MDALAGYGSDSSSSSSHHSDKVELEKEQENEKEGLSGLLASYTDDEDDDDVEHSAKQTATESNAQNGEHLVEENKNNSKLDDAPAVNGKSTKDNTEPPQKKRRRRRWDNPPAEEKLTQSDERSSSLPIPTMSKSLLDGNTIDDKSNDCRALILFDTDYTAKLQQPNSNKTEEAQKDLIDKLNKMHQTFHSSNGNNSKQKQSFATHLKSKKEFGNPHMFPSVVEHFGIDPMGSNLHSSLWDCKEFKEFEYFDRVAAAELQSRERDAEQRALEHAEKQQVDQQIQMAMGGAAVERG